MRSVYALTLVLVAAVAAVLVAAVALPGLAYWTTTATVSATVASGDIAAAFTEIESVTAAYGSTVQSKQCNGAQCEAELTDPAHVYCKAVVQSGSLTVEAKDLAPVASCTYVVDVQNTGTVPIYLAAVKIDGQEYQCTCDNGVCTCDVDDVFTNTKADLYVECPFPIKSGQQATCTITISDADVEDQTDSSVTIELVFAQHVS